MVQDSYAPSGQADYIASQQHRLSAEEVAELEARIQKCSCVLAARQHGAKAVAIPERTRVQEHKMAYAMRAEACLKLHRSEEALADLNEAIALDARFAYAYGLRADAHAQLRNFFEAQKDHCMAEECAPAGAGLRLEADMRRLCTVRGLGRAAAGLLCALVLDLGLMGGRLARMAKHAWARRPW